MRWLWIALCLGTPLLAVADEDLDIPGLDAADLRGDAMIWEDATIYLEPYESSASVRFNVFSRRRDQVGQAIPVRIIDSSLKNFVEIEAPGRGDCTWRKLDVDPRLEGLRLFVRREDLAPVLIKPYEMKWSDGTRLKLAIGMPVMPTSTGDYVVGLKQDKVRVAIPHASVGYLYKGGKITDPEPIKEKSALVSRGASVKLGDEGFQVRSNWYGPAPDRKSETALVKLTARCLEMVISAPVSNFRVTEPPRLIPSALPALPPITGWKIPTGTPLMTPSGREVAVAAKDIGVPLAAPAPEQVCFEARFAMLREDETYGTLSRTVRLCAPGSAVTK